jgi:hypothetical protein
MIGLIWYVFTIILPRGISDGQVFRLWAFKRQVTSGKLQDFVSCNLLLAACPLLLVLLLTRLPGNGL